MNTGDIALLRVMISQSVDSPSLHPLLISTRIALTSPDSNNGYRILWPQISSWPILIIPFPQSSRLNMYHPNAVPAYPRKPDPRAKCKPMTGNRRVEKSSISIQPSEHMAGGKGNEYADNDGRNDHGA